MLASLWLVFAVPLPTVEAMTVKAEMIIDATVLEVRAPPPPTTRRPPDAHTLVLQVNEVLVGGPLSSRIELVATGPRHPFSTRIIVFAHKARVASSCGRDPSTGTVAMYPELQATQVLTWPGGGWELALRNGEFARERDRLLAAVRAQTERRWHGAIATVVVSGKALLVPADDALEREAEAGLASRDTTEVIRSIELLAHFESLAHIERLLALVQTPCDDICQAARKTLTLWQVPLP